MSAQRNSTSHPNRHWQVQCDRGLDQAATLPGGQTKRRPTCDGGIHDIVGLQTFLAASREDLVQIKDLAQIVKSFAQRRLSSSCPSRFFFE
jgi:hypothetical protein